MFDNIGNKIKSLAKIITWVGIGISVVLGVALCFESVIRGIIFILIGALISWVGSFILFGFGELIDNTSQMKQDMEDALIGVHGLRNEVMELKLQTMQMNQKKTAAVHKSAGTAGDDKIYCNKCGKPNIPTMTYCSSCGSKLN